MDLIIGINRFVRRAASSLSRARSSGSVELQPNKVFGEQTSLSGRAVFVAIQCRIERKQRLSLWLVSSYRQTKFIFRYKQLLFNRQNGFLYRIGVYRKRRQTTFRFVDSLQIRFRFVSNLSNLI